MAFETIAVLILLAAFLDLVIGSELPTVRDRDHLYRLVSLRFCVLDHSDARAAADYSAEHDVLAIEMRRRDGGNEELRAICVLEKPRISLFRYTVEWRATDGSRVSHGKQERLFVLVDKVLIFEFVVAVYRLSSSPIVVGEVASLAHEALDDSMECRSLVVERNTGFSLAVSLLAGT